MCHTLSDKRWLTSRSVLLSSYVTWLIAALLASLATELIHCSDRLRRSPGWCEVFARFAWSVCFKPTCLLRQANGSVSFFPVVWNVRCNTENQGLQHRRVRKAGKWQRRTNSTSTQSSSVSWKVQSTKLSVLPCYFQNHAVEMHIYIAMFLNHSRLWVVHLYLWVEGLRSYIGIVDSIRSLERPF